MATYHVDFENGKTKEPLNAYAFNPIGTIVRITSYGRKHCLTTGEQVVLTAFTAYLNATWTITVVNDYQFDLDGAIWAATADPEGFVTPVNMVSNDGSTWALALRKPFNTEDGAIFKIAQSPIPTLIDAGAQWTYRSADVILSAALTTNIDTASVKDWTAAANVTISTNTSRKIGAASLRILPGTLFTTGKVCHKTLPATLDLSSYTKISFYINPYNSGVSASGGYRVCLCSDSAGNTVVDSFDFPTFGQNNSWHTVTVNKGSALGSSINSIAIYRDFVVPSSYFYINHFIACNELTLNTLIGKTNTRESQFYCIQSIIGTTIRLDNCGLATTANPGYDGTTEVTNIFAVQPIPVDPASADIVTGLSNVSFKLLGGWDKETDLQTGISWLDMLQNYKNCMTLSGNNSRFEVEQLGTARGRSPFSGYNLYRIVNVHITGFELSCSIKPSNGAAIWDGLNYYLCRGQMLIGGYGCDLIKNILVASNAVSDYGLSINTMNSRFENITVRNHAYWGFSLESTSGFNYIKNLTIKDPLYNLYYINGCKNVIENLVIDSTVIDGSIFGGTVIKDSPALPANGNPIYGSVYNVNKVVGEYEFYVGAKKMSWQTVIKHGTEPGAWLLEGVSLDFAGLYAPPAFPIAEIAVEGGVQITIRVWVRGASTSDFITIRRERSFNIDSDYYTYALDLGLTAWQEIGITLVPERTGVLTLECRGCYNIYVGSISIT